MAILDKKITDTDVLQKGVISAPDRLTGSAQENKAVFDRLIRDSVKESYNGLIDELIAPTGADQIGVNPADFDGAATVGEALLETKREIQEIVVEAGAVSSVFGRAGAVTAKKGDYSPGDIGVRNENALINGDFQVWQNGDSLPAGAPFSADRWALSGSPAALSLISSQKSPDVPGEAYAAASLCLTLSAALPETGEAALTQRLSNHTAYNEKPIVLSFWVKGSALAQFWCGAFGAIEAQVTLTGTWQRVVVKGAAPLLNGDVTLFCKKAGDAGTPAGNYFFTAAKLEAGEAESAFSPRPYAEELTACQRYNSDGSLFGALIQANENLLINGDFRAPVNQRGNATYTAEGDYTIDRWRIMEANGGNLTVQADGIVLSAGPGGPFSIGQYIEGWERLKGEKAAFSVKTQNGTIYAAAQIPAGDDPFSSAPAPLRGASGASVGAVRLLKDAAAPAMLLAITLNAGETLKLYWAKVEAGASRTPYAPRPVGAELALCQRYFYRLMDGQSPNAIAATGFSGQWSSGIFKAVIPTPVTMRVSPTVTYTGDFWVRAGIQSAGWPVTAISLAPTSTQANITLSFTNPNSSGASPGGGMVEANNDSSANIYLDAEL